MRLFRAAGVASLVTVVVAKPADENVATADTSSAPRDLYGYYPSSYAPAPFAQGPHVHVRHTTPATRIAATPIRVAEAVAQRAPPCLQGGCRPTILQAPPVVLQRQEVSHVIRELTCPTGMTLQDQQCLGHDTVPASYVCPTGTRDDGTGRCSCTTQALAECPYGFEMSSGGQCSACDLQPASFTCHDPSAVLDGASCVVTTTSPPYCPPGYTLDIQSRTCTQQVSPLNVCPSGYTPSSGQTCIRSNTYPAQMICPDGAELSADRTRCTVYKQDPPYCPARFNFDGSYGGRGSCVQALPRMPSPCPPGMSRVGDSCERCDRLPAEVVCPSDYNLEGQNCVKEVPQPPRCPPGHNHSTMRPGMCEKCVKQVPQCEPGTRMVGSGSATRCETTTVHPAVECCPPGFSLENGRCRREERLAPEMKCHDDCYRTRTTKAAYACPDGMEFVDHPTSPSCRRPIYECPSIPQAHARCMKALSEKPDEKATDDTAQKRDLQGCPSPAVLTSYVEQCRRPADVVPAQPFCPEGGILEGTRCVVREPVIPERRCPVGTLDNTTGECVRESFVPVKQDCPAGTTRRGSSCITTEQQAPQMVCPPGSEQSSSGVCVVVAPTIHTAPVVSRIPVSYSCSVGRLQGRECVDTQRVPASTCCPPNTEEASDGRCLRRTDMISPAPVEKTVRSSYICPNGGTLSGNNRHCTTSEAVPMNQVCPNDTTTDYSGNCIRSVAAVVPQPKQTCSPARPVCPPGSQLRGNHCVTQRFLAASYSCPAGYDLNGSSCIREAPKIPICPAGTDLDYSGSNCSRRISAPATVRLVQGCVHEVVTPCATCPRPTVCHRG